MFIILILLGAVALATPAAAQPPSARPRLEPVIVETERVPPERTRTDEQELQRVPGGVDLVPQRKIEESRGANLKDALDFVPGVLVRPRFGAADESQLSIRGSGLRNNFHLRGVNVLIDGFREHSQQARGRFYSTFGYNLGGGASLRFDLSYVRNEEELPGSLTQRELDRDRTQANPAKRLMEVEMMSLWKPTRRPT